MRVSPIAADRLDEATVELDPMETVALRAALGEICYGFAVRNFEVRMGSTQNEARQLFEKMDQLADHPQHRVVLTSAQIRLLKKAHEETLRELGPEEYETRTGVAFAFGQALLQQFDKMTVWDGG